MARGEREVKVTVLGDSKGAQRALSDLNDHAKKSDGVFDDLGGKLAKFGKVAALGLGAAAVGAGVFLKGAVEAAEESRKVMAQTDAAIKSTGGAAKVTAKDVDDLASSLSAMSAVDDEVIATGANMLLTFTNVRNEVGKGNDIFNQATKSALNMSVALGTDMQSASMLVGKALNDPIAGLTALTRSGIQFTDQQKEQIKTMVEAGDTLGAQKIILKELETQFGGSAAAAASPMERLKVVIGNLQEEIGARLLPVVAAAASFLADKLPAAMDKIGAVVGPLIDKVSLFAAAFRSAFSGEGITSDGFVGVMEQIGVAARAVVDWFIANWPQIQATVTEVLTAVQAVISDFITIGLTIWNNFGEQIVSYTQNAFNNMMAIIGGTLDVIRGIMVAVTAIMQGDWSAAWEGIKQILSGALDIIVGLIQQAWNIAQSLTSAATEVMSSVIHSAFNGVVGFIASIPGRITGALGNLGGLLVGAGQDLIWGFLNGITSMASRLANAAVEVARKAVNAVKSFLGIGSPSKLFEGFGRNIGEGLSGGMVKSQAIVAKAGQSLAAASVSPALQKYLAFSASEGDWLNDWLTHIPADQRDAALALGKEAARTGVVPGSSDGGSGGAMVYVTVGTLVGSDGMHELAEIIQSHLLQKQRRVPSLGLT